MRPIATESERSRIDGPHRTERVPLDAGNLHEPPDWVAGHAEVMFDTDCGGILNLVVSAAECGRQTGRSHGAGHPDFALTADFGA